MLLVLVATAALAADAKEIAHRDGANLQRPIWSTDGTKLAYEANFHEKKTIELYTGDPKLGSFLRVTPSVRGASSMTAGFSSTSKGGQVAHDLDWSPAAMGRYVYSASDDDLDYDLYLGGGSALAAAPGADGSPAWSPDGKWIAFTSARTGQGDLYLLDVNHTELAPRRLTTTADGSELGATWSPDSTEIVYVGHSDKGDNLWMLPSLTAAPVQLTTSPHSQVRPSFSPTSTKVAYYANGDDVEKFDLYVVDAKPGAVPVQLAKNVVLNATGPVWTPDGRYVVAVLKDDQKFNPMEAISATDPATFKTLDFGTMGQGDLDVAKGADGNLWVAFVAQGKKTDTTRSFDKLYLGQLPVLP